MNNDIIKTQHYTTESEKICHNLIHYIPDDALLIEPFSGAGDLIQLFQSHYWECYDINDNGYNIIQDTLQNPPDYQGKWVITNPPYLAKNKAKDKTIFNLYKTDDLYKAALLSMLDVEGGILIIPTNFFSDERTKDVRNKFLSKFQILELNIFTVPMFNTTTYSICSFAFVKKNNQTQIIPTNILPEGQHNTISLNKEDNYRIGGEVFRQLSQQKLIFGRLQNTSTDYITNIKLYAIDTRTEKIHVEYDTNHFIGKDTDRTYATFTCKFELTEEQEKQLITEFNSQLTKFRVDYYDLPLTNYRDFNRKRIGFTFAYQLMSKIYYEFDFS